MGLKSRLILFLALTGVGRLHAADVWVVGGSADAGTDNPCYFTAWTGDTVFHNANDSVASVRFVDVSDGPVSPGSPMSFTIQPHTTASLRSRVAGAWGPELSRPIWLVHLDIPTGVLVENRLEIGSTDCFGHPQSRAPFFGKVSFPVFRSLRTPGEQQIHLGSDLGVLSARINVGIYNAGDTTSTGRVEVRRACDDFVLAAKDVTLAPRHFEQFTLLPPTPSVTPDPCAVDAPRGWVAYATVVLDQPSLSYVTPVANSLPSFPPGVKVPWAVTVSQ